MKSILAWLVISMLWAATAFADQTPRIDKDELKAMLGNKDLVILDVRQGRDWEESRFKIKNAIRVKGDDLSIVKNYPKDNTFVLYCA
jgi:rhodanese-related sulfurtransferase